MSTKPLICVFPGCFISFPPEVFLCFVVFVFLECVLAPLVHGVRIPTNRGTKSPGKLLANRDRHMFPLLDKGL